MLTEHYIWCDRDFNPIEKDIAYRNVYTSETLGHVDRIVENARLESPRGDICINPFVIFSNGKKIPCGQGFQLVAGIKSIPFIARDGYEIEFALLDGENMRWHSHFDNSFKFWKRTDDFIEQKGKKCLLENILKKETQIPSGAKKVLEDRLLELCEKKVVEEIR